MNCWLLQRQARATRRGGYHSGRQKQSDQHVSDREGGEPMPVSTGVVGPDNFSIPLIRHQIATGEITTRQALNGR